MTVDALCAFADCGRKSHARGWCVSHYGQYNRGVEMRAIRPRRSETGTKRTKRDLWLWNYYRLTLEEYDDLALAGCVLCGSYEDLVVDHDHTCCPGRRSCGSCVRGVLCRTHNVWLGMIKDDPVFVERAVKYLKGCLS